MPKRNKKKTALVPSLLRLAETKSHRLSDVNVTTQDLLARLIRINPAVLRHLKNDSHDLLTPAFLRKMVPEAPHMLEYIPKLRPELMDLIWDGKSITAEARSCNLSRLNDLVPRWDNLDFNVAWI